MNGHSASATEEQRQKAREVLARMLGQQTERKMVRRM
jgi:hypothetical protein